MKALVKDTQGGAPLFVRVRHQGRNYWVPDWCVSRPPQDYPGIEVAARQACIWLGVVWLNHRRALKS